MEQIYNQLIEGLHEVFPESEDLTFAPDSILGDLPDWDSMAAVNLQSHLRQVLDIEIPLDLLADETTIEELAAFMKESHVREAV